MNDKPLCWGVGEAVDIVAKIKEKSEE